MGQEEGRCLQVPDRMGEGMFQGRKTRLPFSGAVAARPRWARDTVSVCVRVRSKEKEGIRVPLYERGE